MAFPVVGPAERQDLALAASREQEEADDGGLLRIPLGMGRQPLGQPANLLVGQEPLAPLPAIAPDAAAGVGPLRAKAHRFRLLHDDGEDRHGPVGRDRRRAQGGEPVSDVLPVDLVDRATGEVRQDLLAQIAPVHIGGPWLPDPFVSLEHGLGNGLQQRLVGPERYGPAPADRGHHLGGAGPRLADGHGRGIANNLPDALSSMLAMDEKPFTVGG